MSIKQLSVFAENKPGAVAQITDVLSENSIDMRAMNIADTQDFGILRMIVSDTEKARLALKESPLCRIGHRRCLRRNARPPGSARQYHQAPCGEQR